MELVCCGLRNRLIKRQGIPEEVWILRLFQIGFKKSVLRNIRSKSELVIRNYLKDGFLTLYINCLLRHKLKKVCLKLLNRPNFSRAQKSTG
jgi:hypothetical protein